MYKPNLQAPPAYPSFMLPPPIQQFNNPSQLFAFNSFIELQFRDLNSQLGSLKNQNTDLIDENQTLKNQIDILRQQCAEFSKLLANSNNSVKIPLKREEPIKNILKIEADTPSHQTRSQTNIEEDLRSNKSSTKREASSPSSEEDDDDDDEVYEPTIVVKPTNKEGVRKSRATKSKNKKVQNLESEDEEIKSNQRSIAKHVWIQYGRRIKDFALNQTDIDEAVKQKIKDRRLETKSDYTLLFQINADDQTDEINFKQTYLDKAMEFMEQMKRPDSLFLNSNYRNELLQQREKVEKWIKQCKQTKRYH